MNIVKWNFGHKSTIPKSKLGAKYYSTAITKGFRSVLALHRPGENPMESENLKVEKTLMGEKTQIKTSYTCTYTCMTPLKQRNNGRTELTTIWQVNLMWWSLTEVLSVINRTGWQCDLMGILGIWIGYRKLLLVLRTGADCTVWQVHTLQVIVFPEL